MPSNTTAPPSRRNRSMPSSAVIPVLHYPDAAEAAAWLCRAFGFYERLRIGTHRIQLQVSRAGGAVVVVQGSSPSLQSQVPHFSVMIRILNADEHYERARVAGATIVSAPTTFPYGERQYSAVDPAGYLWTFSETVADVEPSAWGGLVVDEGDETPA